MECGVEVGRIAVLLKRRDRWLSLRLALHVVGGVPLTAIGPAVLATILWFAAGSVADVWLPWTRWFGLLSVVSVPLLMRLEARTNGQYLGDALRGTQPGIDPLTSLPMIIPAFGGVAWVPGLANPRGFFAGVMEYFLWGPRLLVGAFRQWRVRRRLGQIDLRRAARLVAELCSREKGIDLVAVPKGGEQLTDVLPVLNWLVFQGWIGVGDKVPRVYLYTEARAALGRGPASNSRMV